MLVRARQWADSLRRYATIRLAARAKVLPFVIDEGPSLAGSVRVTNKEARETRVVGDSGVAEAPVRGRKVERICVCKHHSRTLQQASTSSSSSGLR